jgi:hypothetical protein
MGEIYLKLVYEKLYCNFTDRESPLWKTFFENEVEGFEKFKEHVYQDYSIVLNVDTLTEDNFNARSDYLAGLILGKIQRMEFFRLQSIGGGRSGVYTI